MIAYNQSFGKLKKPGTISREIDHIIIININTIWILSIPETNEYDCNFYVLFYEIGSNGQIDLLSPMSLFMWCRVSDPFF